MEAPAYKTPCQVNQRLQIDILAKSKSIDLPKKWLWKVNPVDFLLTRKVFALYGIRGEENEFA